MGSVYSLLQIMSDGQVYSGLQLCDRLGLTKAQVLATIEAARRTGLEVQGAGESKYRLERPLELLDRNSLIRAFGFAESSRDPRLEVLFEVDSTNAHLMGLVKAGAKAPYFCIAENQTAGRGRCGRRWVNPLASQITFSALHSFDLPPHALSGLSLVAGIAIGSSLQDYGFQGIQIKWPNDLVCGNKKLGGLLLELVGEGSGPCHVVTGVGLNYQLPPSTSELLDQPWVDLATFGQVRPGARNRIAGRLMAALDAAYAEFARFGFERFQPAWAHFDALQNKRIDVLTSNSVISGRALGIAPDGTLRVLVGDQIKRFASADISVRQSS